MRRHGVVPLLSTESFLRLPTPLVTLIRKSQARRLRQAGRGTQKPPRGDRQRRRRRQGQ